MYCLEPCSCSRHGITHGTFKKMVLFYSQELVTRINIHTYWYEYILITPVYYLYLYLTGFYSPSEYPELGDEVPNPDHRLGEH